MTASSHVTRRWSARLARRIQARRRRQAALRWGVALVTVLASASLVAAPRGTSDPAEGVVDLPAAGPAAPPRPRPFVAPPGRTRAAAPRAPEATVGPDGIVELAL